MFLFHRSMRKSKTYYNSFILLILLITFFLIPFLGLANLSPINHDLNPNEEINVDQISSLFTNKINSDNLDLNIHVENEGSVFDEKLKEYLSGTKSFDKMTQANIKVIILFQSDTTKQERVSIIDSIIEDYEILANYDIIPAIYLKLNPNQLIVNEKSLEEAESIKSVYKSQIYNSPYISEEDFEFNALDQDFYSNWWLSAIGAENLSYDGSGVRVAVIDTGVYDHPALNVIENRNFVFNESIQNYDDNVGHGTHVAGIIGGDGSGSSGEEYRGIAPGALIINARAGNESGLEEGDIINAIEWSAKPTDSDGAGADIISMSFGGGDASISDPITQAISSAKNNYGVMFVAAAGNSGPDYFTGSTPATGIDVISVGATDKDDELASFSSWGPTFGYIGFPDVVAPGVNIISADAPQSSISKEKRYKGDYFDFSGDADYIPLSGTSMAAPVVSGALAILKQAFPSITPETARIALLEGARRLSNEEEDDYLKSGAGLINISASIDYLNNLLVDINDIAKIYPDDLPIKPFDLLNFPSDHQKFDLTILSGKSNTFNIDLPNNIPGVSILLDKTSIVFTDSGIGFVEIDIQIHNTAVPDNRSFQLNLTKDGQVYDTVDITLEIRLPEYKVLMESYHGLNDWFPSKSFYQMGFYEAISDLVNWNLSVDYLMEYWTPDYNTDYNNSILTEERLAQYDLIILQSPILPYSPLEIDNLVNYFENGGNILFLGTRYQDMVVENVNYLFKELAIDIEINEENIMDAEWVGVGVDLDSQSVYEFNNSKIFENVNKFKWFLGNSFTVSNQAESIAALNNQTVVAMYNGTSQGRGRFLAFGDLYWIFNEYTSSTYTNDHSNLLKNIVDYFLPTEQVSMNIQLKHERVSNSKIDLSLYLKNQTTDSPITTADYDSLSVKIVNAPFSNLVRLNTTFTDAGIYFNNSFDLPYPSYSPFSIIVNLTKNSQSFVKMIKILYYDRDQIPKISSLLTDNAKISRSINNSTNIIAELDKDSYEDIDTFLSIYSYSFFNTKTSVNKTLTLSNSSSNYYSANFDPAITDPSGYAIFYIIPENSNYIVPNSPRYLFKIVNKPPEIVENNSFFNYGGNSDILFEDTETDDGSLVYSTSQSTTFNFRIDARDTVNYEDSNSSMRVFVNLIISSVSEDGYLILISPSSFVVSELEYQLSSDMYEGSFTIPSSMSYRSISGTKTISTASGYNDSTKEGYLGVLIISVYDSEGSSEEFIIILSISGSALDLTMIVIFSVIGLLAISSLSIYFIRRRKTRGITYTPTPYSDYQYQPYYRTEEDNGYITPIMEEDYALYCPFCGKGIKTPKKFCSHCGESVEGLF